MNWTEANVHWQPHMAQEIEKDLYSHCYLCVHSCINIHSHFLSRAGRALETSSSLSTSTHCEQWSSLPCIHWHYPSSFLFTTSTFGECWHREGPCPTAEGRGIAVKVGEIQSGLRYLPHLSHPLSEVMRDASSREDSWKPTVIVLTHWGRMTQICVFNTRLFSLHNTLNYAIHRACLRMVLLTDIYRNLTSLWINL